MVAHPALDAETVATTVGGELDGHRFAPTGRPDRCSLGSDLSALDGLVFSTGPGVASGQIEHME